jgi:hypothetical protein
MKPEIGVADCPEALLPARSGRISKGVPIGHAEAANHGHKTPKDQMLEILDRISARTWQKDSERLRGLVSAP